MRTHELDKCRNHILEDVKQNYMPAILKLLDETKDVFRSSVYKEMVLLLDGTKWGIVVDEIISVENLTVIEQKENQWLDRLLYATCWNVRNRMV